MEATPAEISAYVTARLPAAWTAAGEPHVAVDRDEITITLSIEPPAADDDVRDEAIAGRIAGFRDETKQQRIAIAREIEHRFDRKVAWGVAIGDRRALFTHLAVPTMTRLRQPERQVLDTLIGAGVARSRAEALAWCVKLVGEHTAEWLDELREALGAVERVRSEGPGI